MDTDEEEIRNLITLYFKNASKIGIPQSVTFDIDSPLLANLSSDYQTFKKLYPFGDADGYYHFLQRKYLPQKPEIKVEEEKPAESSSSCSALPEETVVSEPANESPAAVLRETVKVEIKTPASAEPKTEDRSETRGIYTEQFASYVLDLYERLIHKPDEQLVRLKNHLAMVSVMPDDVLLKVFYEKEEIQDENERKGDLILFRELIEMNIRITDMMLPAPISL